MKMNRKEREMEIFNSMPHDTFDEVMKVAEAINNYRCKCTVYDQTLEEFDKDIKDNMSLVKDKERQRDLLKEFEESNIGKMIKSYIENKDIDIKDIKSEIKETGNPFHIEVSKGNNRYVFGIGYNCSFYNAYSTVFDIKEDIQKWEKEISDCYKSIYTDCNIRSEIENDGEEGTLWEVKREPTHFKKRWYYDGKLLCSLD